MAEFNPMTAKLKRKPKDYVRWDGEIHEVKEREGMDCSTRCGRYARGESVSCEDRQQLGTTCRRCYESLNVTNISLGEGRPIPLALDQGKAVSALSRLDRTHKRRKRL